MNGQTMTSSRPYLVRALYEWLVDNELTPFLLVNALKEGVQVPSAFIEDDKIILNISPSAVTGLMLGNDEVLFSARFSGQAMDLSVPIDAILAIYAKENSQGMIFNEEGPTDMPPSGGSDSADGGKEPSPAAKKRPSLKIVK